MPEHYTALAPMYHQLGLSSFSMRVIPRLIDYALHMDWFGRSIIDFGCGTGDVTRWLSEADYNVTGIDKSALMLEQAKQQVNPNMGIVLNWVEADIHQLPDTLTPADMVVAMDVVNEMESIRDVQSVFASAHQSLRDEPGKKKLFIFDMYTIEGLTKRGEGGAQLLYHDHSLTVFAQNEYDYESQTATRDHITFSRNENDQWHKLETQRVLRSFPIQAIAALLKRSRFTDVIVLNPALQPITNRELNRNLEHVVFVATKSDGSES